MTFEEFNDKLAGASSREKAYNLAVGYLKDRPHFDWTGVYALEGQELVLRAFVGKPTEHMRIPVGKGICGTAVVEKADQLVNDVTQVKNYLACSIDVKSELVVLIRSGESIYAQIDIDSHEEGAFDPALEAGVRAVAERLAAAYADRRRRGGPPAVGEA